MRRVVHEIRNHLAVAIANIEAFRDGVLAPSPQRLDAVGQALLEAEALLAELAATERTMEREANGVQTFDACRLIVNEVVVFEAAAREKDVQLVIERCAETHPACTTFVGDPTHIAEIVNNLLSNAVRYTPSGGRIVVDCRRADRLTLTVSDSGPGIAPEERERIFESGVRGSAGAATAGSGIGLAIVRRFVEEQGGTIDVGESPEHGARFTIALPGIRPAPRVAPDGAISLL